MKKFLPLIGVLFAACGQKTPEAVQDASMAHAAASPVAAHLDLDGFRVSLGDGRYLWEAVHPNMEIFAEILIASLEPSTPQDDQQQQRVILRELPEILGLHEITAYGHSTRHRQPDGYFSRFVLQVPASAQGLLWHLDGDAVDLPDRIRRLPAASSVVLHFSTDLGPIIDNIDLLARATGASTEDLEASAEWFQENRESVQIVTQALRRGASVAITVNESQTFQTLLPELESIPLVEIAILIPDPQGELTRLVAHGMSTGAPTPLQIRMMDGVQILSFPFPMIEDKGLKLAQFDGFMALTTTMELMQELLERRQGDRDAPLLAQLDPAMPTRVQRAVISDGRLNALLNAFAHAIETMMKDALPADQQVNLEVGVALVEQLFDPHPYSVVRSRKQDFHLSYQVHQVPYLIPGGLNVEPKILFLFASAAFSAMDMMDFMDADFE